MDFKDINNKEILKKEIQSLINEYKAMLLQWTDSPTASDYKRAALMFYWLRDYKRMISYESQFDPYKLKKYSRGDVISINLGFNPAGEEGGLHYAIVMEDNPRSSSTVTVVPLRSQKSKDKNGIHWTELSIGNELFIRLQTKLKTLQTSFNKNTSTIDTNIRVRENELSYITNILKGFSAEEPDQVNQQNTSSLPDATLKTIIKLQNSIEEQLAEDRTSLSILRNDAIRLKQCKNQYKHMKSGSIVMAGKITTLSKLRIINPIDENDPLAGIRISKGTMDKICQKVKDLYFTSQE